MRAIRGTARSILDALPEGHVGGYALVRHDTTDDEMRELAARGVRAERSTWTLGEWTAEQREGES